MTTGTKVLLETHLLIHSSQTAGSTIHMPSSTDWIYGLAFLFVLFIILFMVQLVQYGDHTSVFLAHLKLCIL